MPNPLCHFDLMVSDTDTARQFYGSVFDWEFDDDSMPGYSLINAGAEPTGGMFQKPESAPGACLNVYFQVEDMADTLARAEQQGGTVVMQPQQIPGVGAIAMVQDPDGIVIGLLKPEE